MRQDLDHSLCRDLPEIFAQRHLSPEQTVMARGFECGDGWYHLIHALCETIRDHEGHDPEVPRTVAVQV
jgi:hypothetical protein